MEQNTNETKRRGRPKKVVEEKPTTAAVPAKRGRPSKAKTEEVTVAPKKRGRPSKANVEKKTVPTVAPAKRGRPPKANDGEKKETVKNSSLLEKAKKEPVGGAKQKKSRPEIMTAMKSGFVNTKKISTEELADATKKRKTAVLQKKGKTNDMPTIGVVSLGCDKNRVDTENMLTSLKNAGYKFTADPSKADAIIVNTCCFIRSARDESEDAIAEMAEYKKSGKCKHVLVSGCLPQYDLKSLQNEFPEVDAFIGINEYKNIVKIVDNMFNINKKIRLVGSPMCIDYVKDRITTTPKHLAYLKIADGCNNFCSFCTIPYIRGRYRSRKMDSLIEEAKGLVSRGAKEIVLVAQDTTRYGIDLYGKPMIVELLQKLSKIEGIKWIRLLYCYPEMVTDELINEIANNPKVCNYIDVPFQHVADGVLKRMNRRCTYAQTVELIKKLKAAADFIAIRTTYMVGFPGETKQDFKTLYNFIKNNKLSNVGFFAYSREAGTAAFDLPDQVDESVKNKRLIKLVKLQKSIHKRIAAKNHVGKTYDVLCEGFDQERGMWIGRNEHQAPDIDTNVFFIADEPLKIGEIYRVKINKIKDYDLFGEVAD